MCPSNLFLPNAPGDGAPKVFRLWDALRFIWDLFSRRTSVVYAIEPGGRRLTGLLVLLPGLLPQFLC